MKKDEIKAKDEAWKKELIKRDGKRCCLCETERYVQGAHIFSRTYRNTRWISDNGVRLCVRHHMYWIPSHPVEFTWYLEKRFGKRKLKALFKKSGSKNIWE